MRIYLTIHFSTDIGIVNVSSKFICRVELEMAIQQTEIASALAELAKLSSDELKELCNSSSHDKYDELVNQTDRVSNFD